MPYALDGTIHTEDYIKSDEKLLASAGIDLFVTHIRELFSQENKMVSTEGEEFFYENLILAVGSLPVLSPLEGIDLKNVFTIKDHPDIEAILENLSEAKEATVVGAGFIGLELAAAFKNRGLKVNVVEREEYPLASNVSSDLGKIVKEELEKNGIRLYMKTLAEGVVGEEKAEGVILSDGQRINSDIVVFSVGVKSNLSLIKDTKIETGTYGIKTDEYMRTNIKNIYAIGDCVESRDFFTGEATVSFLATTAAVQAKVAAINVTGGQRVFEGVINPAITRVFGLSFGATGMIKERAEKEGFDIVYADSETFTREKSFAGAGMLKTRLIARADDLTIIGAEVVSTECIAYIINMLSLAILNRNTAQDLACLQYCGHPPQVDVPSRMHIVLAAEEILRKAGKL